MYLHDDDSRRCAEWFDLQRRIKRDCACDHECNDRDDEHRATVRISDHRDELSHELRRDGIACGVYRVHFEWVDLRNHCNYRQFQHHAARNQCGRNWISCTRGYR